MNLQASSTINPIGNEPRELLTTEIIKYQLRNIKLPSTRRRNVQLERVSMATTFFLLGTSVVIVGTAASRLKERPPRVWFGFDFRGSLQRGECRAAYAVGCAHCAPALKAIMSAENRGRVWERYTRCSRGALV